jgi:chorismate synthase
VRIGNSEWPKWETVMAADPVDAETLAAQARNAPLTRPRPGHADLAGMQKYDVDDARPILERASARETAARVALGTVARAFLRQALGVEVLSHVVSIGSVAAPIGVIPRPGDEERVDASPVRCLDDDASAAMVAEIDQTKRAGDTLGGVVEVVAYGLPPGLGSHAQADRRLDSRLAAALMGIQAIKGVEVGDGFELARIRGSQAHDEIVRDGNGAIRRVSGRSGGTEGGMTTGELLRVRAAMKPISTVPRALSTVDTATGEAAVAINQRSDVCAVPAAGVVAEAMVALVLADAALEKFGGDSLGETRRNVAAYLERLRERGLTPAPAAEAEPAQ